MRHVRQNCTQRNGSIHVMVVGSHCMFPALWETSHTSSMVQQHYFIQKEYMNNYMKPVLYPTPPFVDHFAFGVLLDACSLPLLSFPCPEVLYTFVLKNVLKNWKI